jgi:hypothetical protein
MCKQTKKTFIIAVVVTALSLASCLFLLFEIRSQGLSLENHVSILGENYAKETAYSNLNKLIHETKQDREMLSKAFLRSESDGINIPNELEILAPSLGLEFETMSLSPIVDKGGNITSVGMSFIYSGKKRSVLGMTEIMEHLPYHSSVMSLSIRELDQDDFEGRITIHVTIQPS